MEKLRLRQVVLVEGRYDAAKLAGIVDGLILTTDGFAIYKDQEKRELLKELGRRRGVLILTDSDRAGFQIRNFVSNLVGQQNVLQAYVPALPGKESRKAQPGKEGLLGVEGVPDEVIRRAILTSGAVEAPRRTGREITYSDLYEWGLSGTAGSADARRRFLKAVGLPPRLSKKALCQVLSSLYTWEELDEKLHCKELPGPGPELIVMLTWNDQTVPNARQVFEGCKHSKARLWGMKSHPLHREQMKALYAAMKQCGKTTVLEVVEYTEPECLEAVDLAAECGCDILMGTQFFDSVNEACRARGVRYMPFVGQVSGCPSVLWGTPEEMVRQAREYLEKGAYGIDLLGYRLTEAPEELIRTVVEQVDAPVCVAGSVNSWQRLDFLKQTRPWAFTIGGAFFENRFGQGLSEQINGVCAYMEQDSAQ